MILRSLAFIASLTICGLSQAAPAWLDPASGDVTVVLNSGDNQFSFYEGPGNQAEWLVNRGASTRTRIKSYQDVSALKFDLSSFKGQTVEDAELHVAKANGDPVFSLVAATINADWPEGSGNGGNAAVGDSCWRWRRMPADVNNPAPGDEWSFSHSDFSTATFGHYGSLVSFGFRAEGTFGTYTIGSQEWLRMKLNPGVVHALILDQFGLAITDARGHNLSYNPQIYTRNQNSAVQPRLLIKLSSSPAPGAPGIAGSLQAAPADMDGEALLQFTAPANALGYTVRYSQGGDFASAADVERWRIPRPKTPGANQKVLIEDLIPGAAYRFFVRAYNAAGADGTVASVDFALPAAQTPASLIDGGLPTPNPSGKTIRSVPGALRYWACPETTKVNPATGNRIEDGYAGSGADDYKKANPVWDADTKTVSLKAARNEMAGFQLVLERLGASLDNAHVSLSDLRGPAGSRIPNGTHVEISQLHYVNNAGAKYPDAAIPLASPLPASFSIPDVNHNNGGQNQSIWIDIYVPKTASPGEHTGTIKIDADQLSSSEYVNLSLNISPVELPDFPAFLIDLNGYSRHWNFGNVNTTRTRYFQMAQKHRTSLNILPYGWSANIHPNRAPALSGSGATIAASDWSAIDQTFGPMLDGSAFTPSTSGSPYYGPGTNTPVPTFYTPFFESWPIHIQDATHGFDAAGSGGAYWDSLLGTNLDMAFTEMPDTWNAFPESYKTGVRKIAKEWLEHAQAMGWHQTHFQSYLNHKYSYGGCAALWVLEECETADDFRAMSFFQSLWREGAALASAPDVDWHWRLDISDRWGQNYGQMNERINWMVMNGSSTDWHWPQIRYRNIANELREQWIYYGTGPAPQDAGTGHAQRFLQAWAQGLDGGAPYWDNFQTDWTNAAALSVVYSGQNIPGFGQYDGPIPSIRLKLMRQAIQIIELANLLAQQPGWSRSRVAAAILGKYADGDWNRSFDGLDELEIYKLRYDLLAEIEDAIGSGAADSSLLELP
jgi:hypothetical protein